MKHANGFHQFLKDVNKQFRYSVIQMFGKNGPLGYFVTLQVVLFSFLFMSEKFSLWFTIPMFLLGFLFIAEEIWLLKTKAKQ